jgi:hypothetical protein
MSQRETEKEDKMRCEEALHSWQEELLGRPVDRDKLEAAYAHIGACQELCARTLSAAPDFDLPALSERRAGQTDLYEALGLAAEEEGDEHARKWARLRRNLSTGKVTQEALDYERALAVAAWQSAANYYHDGLRVGETAFLTEGLKRLKQKRLEPASSPQQRHRPETAPAKYPARSRRRPRRRGTRETR